MNGTSIIRPRPSRSRSASAQMTPKAACTPPFGSAEVQVHALDAGGALVQAVDLGVPDVLLDRVVLQETRSAEGLQRQREHLVRPLRPQALDHRKQQIVQAGRLLVGPPFSRGRLQVVLDRRHVQDQRAHAFGVRLLQHQHPADVRVVGDRDPRRRLVEHLGEVGPLDPAPGELQRVQVAGRQCADGLDADDHPGVLDDVEHLPDTVVYAADQGPDRRAGRRRTSPHTSWRPSGPSCARRW